MFFNYRTGGEFMPPAWCRKRMCSHIGRTASAAALVTGGSGGFSPSAQLYHKSTDKYCQHLFENILWK